MPIEREAKFRVENHEPVREALAAAGAQRLGLVLECNHVFDRPDGELRLRGAALRVRTCTSLEGGSGTALFTYKALGGTSRFKTREEIETNVADGGRLVSILESVGFQRTVYYEKRRESWILDECRVELDELPELGLFVEIEGASDEAIETIGRRLGLSSAEHLGEGYLALIASHCRKLRRSELRVAFDE